MTQLQKTIAQEGALEGIGIHTGGKCRVHISPAPVDTGLRFFKNGNPIQNVWSETRRQTSIGAGNQVVMTVEHLLAAANGLEISNLNVNVDGPEIPIGDGSALEMVRLFKKLGIVEQSKPREVFKIEEPIFCFDEQKAIAALPCESFEIGYVLDFAHPALSGQKFEFKADPERFEREVAPARTFCLKSDADAARQAGFGKGANTYNTLVIGDEGVLENELLFSDECARHKVLDIIGDLALLGFALQAKIWAIRSGHDLNRRLAAEILKRRNNELVKF